MIMHQGAVEPQIQSSYEMLFAESCCPAWDCSSYKGVLSEMLLVPACRDSKDAGALVQPLGHVQRVHPPPAGLDGWPHRGHQC